jgi:hypothetical protein
MALELRMEAGDDYGSVSTPIPNENTNINNENLSGKRLTGRRLNNPLGYYSSYNYQISLYLTTPQGMDLFKATEKKDISILTNSENAYLVAQSGGINKQINNTAPGFENLDYYIDDLVLTNATAASNGSTATNITDVKFKVIEPYGFSFITNLKKARDAFANSVVLPKNATRLPILLSVGFLGYDENGKLMSGNQQYDNLALEPGNDSNKLFTRYYILEINSVKFKIDGKATVYDISAKPVAQTRAFGIVNGFINNAVSINAKTVGSTLLILMEDLNRQERQFVTDNLVEYPNIYEIEFRPDTDNSIRNSDIVNPSDLNKYRFQASNAEDTTEAAVENQEAADPTRETITLEKISIMEGISQIIKQSSYMTDALRAVSSANLEPNPDGSGRDNVSTSSKNFSWYTLSARVRNGRWDTKRKDFTYTITYVIEPYATPVISHPQANPGVGYYGPHKRYEYWYTGKNSEILEYEQRLDVNYFNVIYDATPDTANANGEGNNAEVTLTPNQQSSGNRTGSSGDNLGVTNAVLTDLTDPKGLASAKITILGDPDFLMEDTTDSPAQVYNQFYGADDFTISANGGQVFIEIDFNEAVDYDLNSGTLSINNKIKFWNYPEEANISGLSYQVVRVTSTFAGGVFKQVVECKMTYDFTNPVIGNQRDEAGLFVGPPPFVGPQQPPPFVGPPQRPRVDVRSFDNSLGIDFSAFSSNTEEEDSNSFVSNFLDALRGPPGAR